MEIKLRSTFSLIYKIKKAKYRFFLKLCTNLELYYNTK